MKRKEKNKMKWKEIENEVSRDRIGHDPPRRWCGTSDVLVKVVGRRRC